MNNWSLSLDIDLSSEDCFVFIGLFKATNDDRIDWILNRFFCLDRNHGLYCAHAHLSTIRIIVHYFYLLLLMLRIYLHYFTISTTFSHQSFCLYHSISCLINYWEFISRTIYFFCTTFILNSFFIISLSYFDIF
jgi:hypothetical protein